MTHLGKNTGSGHYVAHVYKDGAWTFFNDSAVSGGWTQVVDAASTLTRLLDVTVQVTVCDTPPFDLGYMYFYRRL